MTTAYTSLSFPHQHQYVLIDTTIDQANMKPLQKIPLEFWIDFNDTGVVNPPKLTMLVNPQTMSHSFTKKKSSQYSRGGWIREEWGENLDVLSFSGKIGAYYVKEADIGFSGLNRYERSKSLSFKNLYNLLMVYRSNGAIYQNIAIGKTGAQNRLMSVNGYSQINKRVKSIVLSSKARIDKIGDVYLYFDNYIYIGSFDTFSIDENANNPFTLTYSIQFTVHYRTQTDSRPYVNYEQTNDHLDDIYKNKEQYSHLRRVEKSTINVERIAQAEEKSNVAPKSLNDNYTRSNVPDKATLSHVRYLESNGYSVQTEERLKLKDSYGKADTSVYQDSVDLSKNIQAINYDIVKRTGISDGEANSKSRKLTDINMRTYSDIKANAK